MERRSLAVAWIAILTPLTQVLAASFPAPAGAAGRTLIVGVCELAPYSFKQPNGEWEGMAIQLWTIAARSLGIPFQWRELSIGEVVDALESGTIDVAATGMPVDASHARRLVFSQPFESSAVVIATRSASRGGFLDGIRRIATSEVFIWLLVLLGAMVAAAITIALLERRRNPHFLAGARGVGEGLWWSITTFSTVGYGDRVPITRAGRIMAGAWMLIAFALMTIFSGLIAANLTVGRLNPVVRDAEDLRMHPVGAIDGGIASQLLLSLGVHRLTPFPTVEAGLVALRDHRIDALVSDSIVLHYLLKQRRFNSLMVLPGSIERDFVALGYARALPPALRESIDQTILEAVESPEWSRYLERLIGSSSS